MQKFFKIFYMLIDINCPWTVTAKRFDVESKGPFQVKNLMPGFTLLWYDVVPSGSVKESLAQVSSQSNNSTLLCLSDSSG